MQFPTAIPFVQMLGFELLRFDGGHAEIRLPLRDELANAWGAAHGGVVMTLLDTAMAHAARSPQTADEPSHPGVVTIEMKTSFLRPGAGTLVARASVLRRTASLAFCEGHVVGDDGQMAAHATATFKFMRHRPLASD